MTFDPSSIGISNTTGNYPSETIFTVDENNIRVVSDGDPFPAKAGDPFVNDGFTERSGFGFGTRISDQAYDYTFNYRGGRVSQNPQDVTTGPIGIAANGVQLFPPNGLARPLPGSIISPPEDLTWNTVHFLDIYGPDASDGYPESSGQYVYKTGKFVPFAFSREYKIYNENSYYGSNSYGNDYMRHPDGHSKIIGYAYDGFPIYGPYGYTDPEEPTSRFKQMVSSYQLRDTDKHRPIGWKYTDTILFSSGERVLEPGSFVEDYVFAQDSGTLDRYNGRYCVTPEYPQGTYAYFLTFEDRNLTIPSYPYIVGPQTKQKRTAGIGAPTDAISLWNIGSGVTLTTTIERQTVELQLPVANGVFPRIELISGELPSGLRIEGTKLLGTPFEVERDKVFRFVLRAFYNGTLEDRTFNINVVGPDDPVWLTNEGLLPVGNNNAFYILDNQIIDFQLVATDSDLPAGDVLEYYIAEGDGNLPPGIELTIDGRLTGVVEPLLALDQRAGLGGYDTQPYDYLLNDYGIRSTNGYGSFYYDSETFDYSVDTRLPKKLNRYYPFQVTVTDGDSFVKREFQIYLVGDDFLRADNTIMQAANGVFTADNTYLRNPIWLTPSDLGFKRANNYVTLYLDVIQNDTLAGVVFYELLEFNPDGSTSELPPGLDIDGGTGEVIGRIPYQPAITESYQFTIRATRYEGDLGTATIFGTYYEDTLLGNTSFKVGKLDRSLEDGVDDLNDIVTKPIKIGNRFYTVTKVDGTNRDYDEIFLDQSLAPEISLVLSQLAIPGQTHFFANRLTETEKTKYQSRSLKFSETESYEIQSILPYIEYRANLTTDAPLYIDPDRIQLAIGQEFILGDWASYQGNIYKLAATDVDNEGNSLLTHTVQPLIVDGIVQTDPDGNAIVDFDNSKWALQAADTEDLTQEENISILTRWLQIEYPQGATTRGTAVYETNIYVTDIGNTGPKWQIRLPSTSKSRRINEIKSFFKQPNLNFVLHRDNEDRLKIFSGDDGSPGLARSLNKGRNIGIALFRRDSFSKTVAVAEQDEVVDLPFSDKTFNIRVIGEIDSTIQFLTDGDLGTIPANFVSTLKIEATTTVPDTKLVYTVKQGSLPNGLYLNYSGEIIGRPRQFANDEGPGLTTFDNNAIGFDGIFPGETTFDRSYKFTVEARDRFGLSAIEQEFTLSINDNDNVRYSNIYTKPYLKLDQRNLYKTFVSDPQIFTPSSIYRPDDPDFGIQPDIKMLVFAGIETKNINSYVSALAKHTKRKSYILGDFKVAEAKYPGTTDTVYEVIYIEVIDPAIPKNEGKTKKSFRINTEEVITVDSIQYETKDDNTNTGTGLQELPIYGRETIKFVVPDGDDLIIYTRDSGIEVDADNNDFEIELRDSSSVEIELNITDSEPQRIRPKTNTIKADSDAIRVSDFRDQVRYISNIDNVRDEIRAVGLYEREYLPLWMRTPQGNTYPQELDYITAIPVCFCKPGTGSDILLNINNSNFNPRDIHFEIDRVIVDQTENSSDEQYIVFANYQYNV